MNPQTQTLKFLAAAVVSVLLALGTWSVSRPTPVEGFGKVGESFFEELNANEATGLRVVVFDDEQADMDDFIVQQVDGVWQLPHYNNYPADGEDRLGKTAASLVGTVRGALASRQATDHARLGVVDPEEKSQELEGRGQKITIFTGDAGDLGDKIKMAELIVGKEVPDQSGSYYVRIPEEKETYIASLEIDLSTKFSDWVEDDLLKLDRDKLARLESRTTKVDGQEIVESVESLLTRESSSDDWTLDGLDDETEEVNKDDVTEMVNTLDNLKLAGVRQRPMMEGKQILGGDLKVIMPEGAPPQFMNQLMSMFQRDLQPKGFFLYGNVEQPSLYTSSGELVAGTKDGVRYHMSFGDEFEGTDKEIEVGGTSTKKKDAKEDDDEPAEAAEEKPAGPEEASDDESDDDADSGLKKSRYLFVRAVFDETLIGPALVEPVKPAVPEGVQVDEDGNVVEPETPAEPEAPTAPATPAEPAAPSEPAAPAPATPAPATPAPEAPTPEAPTPEAPAEPAAPTEAEDAAPTEAAPTDADEDATTPEASEAADTQEAADTPKPADAPEAADTPKPADTPEAADTPKPADTPEAADTPKPADTPEAADTPKPADAPEAADTPEAADPPETEPAEEAKPDPVEEYKAALSKYRADKGTFDRETKDRASKGEEGQKTVDELNERFGDWYYVISAEDFNKLRLSRDQVVKAKEKEEPKPGDLPSGFPEGTPVTPPETTPETPATSPEPSDTDPTKPGETPAPAKPTEENPTPEKPAAPAEKPAAPAEKPADPDAPTENSDAPAEKPADPAEKPAPPAEPAPEKPATTTESPASETPASETPAGE